MATGLNNFQSEQNVLSWADAEYQWVKMKNWAKFWKVMNFGNKFGLILSCITISNYSLDLKVHKISITFGRYSCSNGNDQSLRFCFWFIFNSLKINFPIIVKVFSHIWWFVFVAILLINVIFKKVLYFPLRSGCQILRSVKTACTSRLQGGQGVKLWAHIIPLLLSFYNSQVGNLAKLWPHIILSFKFLLFIQIVGTHNSLTFYSSQIGNVICTFIGTFSLWDKKPLNYMSTHFGCTMP